MNFQAVVLGCDDARQLHPFTKDGSSECILPLATRPLLWYPLRALSKANVESVLLVNTPSLLPAATPDNVPSLQVLRESPSVQSVRSWLSKETKVPHCEVCHWADWERVRWTWGCRY